jgi:hypothetical protein
MRYISRAILQAKSGNELADVITSIDQRHRRIVNVSKARPPSPGPTLGRTKLDEKHGSKYICSTIKKADLELNLAILSQNRAALTIYP